MGTEPAPSPPASCQSPPHLPGLPGREEGLCQQSEGLKGEKRRGAPTGAGDPTMPRGSNGGSGLTWGLGTPRCLGAPTGTQGSHGGWGGPAMNH